MLNSYKMLQKQSEVIHTFLWDFPILKQNFIAYRSPKVSSLQDNIFEIHHLWQSAFSRVYSNCCCSCSFEPEMIKIGLSSHNMYSNNVLNFQEYTTILKACMKKSGPYWIPHLYICVCVCVCVCVWEKDLALNKLPGLIHRKTQSTNQ